MVRLLILIILLTHSPKYLLADELYTWLSGKLKTPLLIADPEEFLSSAEVATQNDRLGFSFKLGQHMPMFTYENDIFAFGVGGIIHYAQDYLDVEGQGLGLELERMQLRSGGYIEASYSKLSIRIPAYYETNTLYSDPQDSNFAVVLAPSVHYEFVPDLILYGGTKLLLNSSLNNDKNRYQAGFAYTFGRGYFRPHFGLDFILRENVNEKGRISLRFGTYLGRLDEFLTHSFHFNLELGLMDIGQDSKEYGKIFSFSYSLNY